jgi:hypothetical protein
MMAMLEGSLEAVNSMAIVDSKASYRVGVNMVRSPAQPDGKCLLGTQMLPAIEPRRIMLT